MSSILTFSRHNKNLRCYSQNILDWQGHSDETRTFISHKYNSIIHFKGRKRNPTLFAR